MYVISLKTYDAKIGDRFIIYNDINKKVYKRIMIENNDDFGVSFKDVLDNVDNFKFKFQSYMDGKWMDSCKYFKLVLNSQKLGDFWTDQIDLDQISLNNYITYHTFTKTPFSRAKLLKSFKLVCEDLWLAHNKKHKNLMRYFKFVDSNKNLFNEEWQNLNIYLKHMHNLKIKFQSLGYNKLYYNELQPVIINNNDILNFIEEEIRVLESYNMQFGYLLIAQYYSLLNNRDKAVDYFKKVKNYNNGLESEFGVGQGSSTYNLLQEKRQIHTNNVKFKSVINDLNTDYTILVSVDSKYLKRYGTMIFYNLIALQKYHFHVHVVGDNETTVSTINEAKALFYQMKDFIGKESYIIPPTFSHEELPSYAQSLKAFSATARFINATYFMDRFKTNLLILDADMFLTDDLNNYLNAISKYDVTIAFSQSVTTMLPWRRVMAGNIYLSNNEKSKKFIDITRDYIVDNLKEKQSWTLDQNALTYAYENIFSNYPDIKFGNVYNFKRPFSHPQIRKYIERK